MKKKRYVKPAMQVYEFKRQPVILVGSLGDRDNYDPTDVNPFAP